MPAGTPPPVVEVDTVAGRLLLHRDDEVITQNLIRWGVWEAAETRFLSRRLGPGQTFVDVGANVGYFTVLACRQVGPQGSVLAIEPEPRNLHLLRANLDRGRFSQARVLAVAAYREACWMSLSLNESNRGDHRLAPLQDAQPPVRCVRLDDVLPEVVDMIKVDTQGYDHDVIEGLSATIGANPRLVIITELSLRELQAREVDPAAVLGRYAELGLGCALIDPWGSAHPVEAGEVLAHASRERVDEVTVVLSRH